MKRVARPRRAAKFPAGSKLLPTIVQDALDGRVLGLAYSSRESWSLLRRSRDLVLFSRSRGRLWKKGETSGNTARVISTAVDCDGDALLVQVRPSGPYCHTGSRSCFDAGKPDPDSPPPPILAELEELIGSRRRGAPKSSYTAELLRDEERRLKKVGEEATEVVVAAARRDRAGVIQESRDLIYHLLVLYASMGIRWEEVEQALRDRRAESRPRARTG